MSFETLRLETSDAIARIELHRPEKRNAMDATMASELATALDGLEGDPAIRVVSIRGASGNFCSGGDLAPGGKQSSGAEGHGDERAPSRPGSPTATTLDIMNRVYGRAIRTLHRFPKPVVAIVEGVAAGAGANLALTCDLVYASTSARFCEIFARRGIALDCGGSWLLPRLIGLQKAKELAFFADWVSAERALEIGLVNEIHPEAELSRAVDEKLALLASRPPIALAQIKQSMHRAMSVSMEQALEIEALAQAACTATEDCAEGMQAFMEKREPVFEGR